MADGDRLLEELGKPLGGGCRVARKANVLVGVLRLSPGTESVTELTSGAKAARIQVDGCGALAVQPLAVSGIERPGAVEFKAAARADAGFLHVHRIERFDGMQANVR